MKDHLAVLTILLYVLGFFSLALIIAYLIVNLIVWNWVIGYGIFGVFMLSSIYLFAYFMYKAKGFF